MTGNDSGDQVLCLIVPHPDDEALMTSGVICHALERGRQVRIVIVTNGDIKGKQSGLERQKESVAAMRILGVDEKDIAFLGYPDDVNGLFRILNEFNSDESSYTSGAGLNETYGNAGLGKTDFHSWSTGGPGRYNAIDLQTDIEVLIKAWLPSEIYTSSRFDEHPDHRAVYYLVSRALDLIRREDPSYEPMVFTFIIHDPKSAPFKDFRTETATAFYQEKPDFRGDFIWPEPGHNPGIPDFRFNASQYFTKPPNLWRTELRWSDVVSLPVPHHMQKEIAGKNLKYQVLKCYGSQPLSLLLPFCKKDEIFWKDNQARHTE